MGPVLPMGTTIPNERIAVMKHSPSEDAICRWVEDHTALLDDVNDFIWRCAEPALQEIQSSAHLREVLEKNGFTILPGAVDTPTSFVAQWGAGSPCIGFLAEYDALQGLSQDAVPFQKPLQEGAAGHACGHCAISAALLGAALALKARMEEEGRSGTLRFYGCPAEESLIGKVRMSRDHLFDGCDAAFSCHPNDVSYVWARPSVSLLNLRYNFQGTPAHAGLDPWNGRSALDAVELMNVGANYLREHVPTTCSIQYVITDGGAAPNIVPAHAQVWYMLRAENRTQAEELRRRLHQIAEGAALMTETQMEERFCGGCYAFAPNSVLCDLLQSCMEAVGAPAWTDEDRAFARELSRPLPAGADAAALRQFSLSESDGADGLACAVCPAPYREGIMGASTDVGDVSHQIPVGCVSFAATVLGAPGHSYYYTAACGSGIGHRGVHCAAKIVGLAAYRLLTDPDLLRSAADAHQAVVHNDAYRCPL